MKHPVSQQPVDQQPEGQLTSQTLVSTPGRGFTGIYIYNRVTGLGDTFVPSLSSMVGLGTFGMHIELKMR